jgi:hypothetical protein
VKHMAGMAQGDSEESAARISSPPFLQGCVYTYVSPKAHVQPLLGFLHGLWQIAQTTGLPVSVSRNKMPRETFLDEHAWNRFRSQVEQGKVRCCRMTQYTEEGMTMHSFLPEDRPLPLGAGVEFVPEGGIPEGETRLPFDIVVLKAITRYPTNLSFELDPSAFPPLGFAEVIDRVHRLETNLVMSLDAACACTEKRVSRYRAGYLPRAASHYEDKSLVENLDSRIPGVFWGMFLGPKHIAKLGGKTKVLDALSGCRVDDLSAETEERVYIQLTERIEDFSEGVADKYRPFFEPLLRKE